MALRPTGERWAVPNEDASLATLVTPLQAVCPVRIVLEATGGCQRAVVAALAAAALPVVVVTPRHARDCAKATGQWAQTDVLDARALAPFAEAVRPTPRPLPDAPTDDLRALRARRGPRVAMRTPESTRLGSAPPRVQAELPAQIAWLAQRLAALDDDLDPTLRASPVWRAHVRATLSMSTLVAVRYHPVLKPFYERLCRAGKAKNVALTACMRKLLTILNAMVQHQKPW